MKKVLLSALAICAFGFSNAQSNKKGTMHVNVMGGFLAGNYTAKADEVTPKQKATVSGAQFGATFQYGIAESFSAGIGLELGTSGYSYTNDYYYNNNSNYNYANDPALTTLKVIVSGRYYILNKDKFNVYAGPSIGFTTARDKTVLGYSYASDEKTKYTGLNYGINAGGNYYFTDIVGVIVNLGYEGNSLNSKQHINNIEHTGKSTLSGVKVMAGLALKF